MASLCILPVAVLARPSSGNMASRMGLGQSQPQAPCIPMSSPWHSTSCLARGRDGGYGCPHRPGVHLELMTYKSVIPSAEISFLFNVSRGLNLCCLGIAELRVDGV